MDDGQTWLYRLYGSDLQLLYVGISHRWPSRMKQHSKDKSWFDLVCRVDVESYPSRRDAQKAEQTAISRERPIHNVHYNHPRPEPDDPRQMSRMINQILTDSLRDHSLPLLRELKNRRIRRLMAPHPPRCAALELDHVAEIMALPHGVVRSLVANGDIPSRRQNGRRLVLLDDLDRYVNQLIDESCAGLVSEAEL
jgi:hypothetical protein